MKQTVADLLIERLTDWGVDTIFSLPGDGINAIYESLRKNQDKIRLIQVRHEESAAFAACGYAKFTGKIGVCLATSGPGGVHLLNGLYDAKFDGQPVLAITGHTFHDLIGTHYQQDLDLNKLFLDVASYNERITGPAHVDNVLDEAMKTALSEGGVSHITIPKDVQEIETDSERRSKKNIKGHSESIYAHASSLPGEDLLTEAARVINAGKKIVILAGRGSLHCREEILDLAQKIKGVIVKPLLGKGVVPDDNAFTTGGIGLLGTAPSQDAMNSCDTLIIAGSSFPYLEFYPKPGQAQAVQIDIDPTRIGLRHQVDIGLAGDSKSILRKLLPLINDNSDDRFLRSAQKGMKDWNRLMFERGTRMDLPMKPQVPILALNKFLDDDAIICCDTGTVTTWAARYIFMRDRMMFTASGMLASMANGLPYAIGAAIAFPGRQVVCLTGDGGLSMLMGDLATVTKYKLPIKIIVIKNNTLGQIKWEQMAFEGNPEFAVDLQPINFQMIGEACGIRSYRLEDPKEAIKVLDEAMNHAGPTLVEAVVDKNEPPMPGNISSQQAIKFAQSLLKGEKYRNDIIKSVLRDKVREVV